MKHFLTTVLLLCVLGTTVRAETVIRVNQLGYLPESVKVAVLLSDEPLDIPSFHVVDSDTEAVVFEGTPEPANASLWGKRTALRLRLTPVQKSGTYRIRAAGVESPPIRVGKDVYRGTADFVLKYMRQQRCGFNPYLNARCHQHDGVIVDHPTRTGERIDVTGGWHDASDYLQYTMTSANATYQMLFAFRANPSVYGDEYGADGRSGANGVPDILDEARWGLEWLMKMNPAKNEMYNQIADDRDHRLGYRLPSEDPTDYELGESRPVYFVTGKPQGLGKHINRTTGVASTAAKFASAFALGAETFRESDPAFAETLSAKALDAWEFAKSDPGVCQTACLVSPYFYEEDNYVDDMELAAATFATIADKENFLKDAKYWGELEPVTPWMELNRARHYQFYPFVNLGHALLARSHDPAIAAQFAGNMRQGLELLRDRAADDPFPLGVPFLWCSNNLVTAAATQARLYREITGDETFTELEAALVDWLFGCNPWGTSMICGLPDWGDSPMLPHSAYTYLRKETTFGGLVDGPVYRSIYDSLLGIHLFNPDDYANFNLGKAVYHDDIGDYSSNEPTMDGTAGLSYLLSSLEYEGRKVELRQNIVRDKYGAVVRLDPNRKTVYLAFSAHVDFHDGKQAVADALSAAKVPASFFFTGEFYADPQHRDWIRRLNDAGHDLGAHSDRHLLYADWDDRSKTLVTRQECLDDLAANFEKMRSFGLTRTGNRIYLPPFEWYNGETVVWCEEFGVEVVNFTPGVTTYFDYTTPDMALYKPSDAIFDELKAFEGKNANGLNGAMILVHVGTDPARRDKFYDRLPEVIRWLKEKGYTFGRIVDAM